MNKKSITELQNIAFDVRKMILEMTHQAKSGHTDSALGVVEIAVTLYHYFQVLDPKDPRDPHRTRVFWSAGHYSSLIYATLASLGLINRNELIANYRAINSKFQGHPHALDLPGIEASTGALGIGLSAALGSALNANHQVVCICGDGEMQEGSVWEAISAATHFKAHNLNLVIVDNGLQGDGRVNKIMNIHPLSHRLASFGWDAEEMDGHDCDELINAFRQSFQSIRPFAIIANTTKGRGVPFLEDLDNRHGKPPSDEEFARAIEELYRV